MENAITTPANVQIVVNKKSNALITPSKNPQFGFIQLEEVSENWDMGWLRQTKKSTLVRAEMSALAKLVQDNRSLKLPGKIVVQEFPAEEVPENIAKQFLSSKTLSPQALAEQYVKRAGDNGPILTVGGQPILRFTWYDRTGKVEDINCDHDNGAEVKAYNLTQAAAAPAPAPAAPAPAPTATVAPAEPATAPVATAPELPTGQPVAQAV